MASCTASHGILPLLFTVLEKCSAEGALCLAGNPSSRCCWCKSCASPPMKQSTHPSHDAALQILGIQAVLPQLLGIAAAAVPDLGAGGMGSKVAGGCAPNWQ